ncbi:MAG: sigma-70 family RNA polymerase sigma factor [Phycisphaerales bacterium]|nr:sigma-70 family RNA polymerase sigma factor [Phycisphaerales bacterium]
MADRPTEEHPPPESTDEAAARLLPVVYAELRQIAAGMLRRSSPMSLQPTVLVHETFLKMAAQHAEWANESHFRAVASVAMRRVLADHVRGRSRHKRGGGRRPLSLDVSALGTGERHGAADLDAALEELEASSPRVAKLVIFRFFGDLSVQQAAERLGISLSTAEADWRFARAWLKRRLDGAGP